MADETAEKADFRKRLGRCRDYPEYKRLIEEHRRYEAKAKRQRRMKMSTDSPVEAF